jgi:hypothetical protein
MGQHEAKAAGVGDSDCGKPGGGKASNLASRPKASSGRRVAKANDDGEPDVAAASKEACDLMTSSDQHVDKATAGGEFDDAEADSGKASSASDSKISSGRQKGKTSDGGKSDCRLRGKALSRASILKTSKDEAASKKPAMAEAGDAEGPLMKRQRQSYDASNQSLMKRKKALQSLNQSIIFDAAIDVQFVAEFAEDKFDLLAQLAHAKFMMGKTDKAFGTGPDDQISTWVPDSYFCVQVRWKKSPPELGIRQKGGPQSFVGTLKSGQDWYGV